MCGGKAECHYPRNGHMSSILLWRDLKMRKEVSVAVGHVGAGPAACTAGPLFRKARIPAPPAILVQRRDLFFSTLRPGGWSLESCCTDTGQDGTQRLPRESSRSSAKAGPTGSLAHGM